MRFLNTREDHKYYLDLIMNDKYDSKFYESLVKEWTGIDLGDKYREFYESPASSKFHGDHPCGLVQHSIAVYYCALRLAEAFNMKPEDINVTACMFHDLCKSNAYRPVKVATQKYAYNSDIVICQHGAESLLRLAELGIFLPENWRLAVAYHMGAFMSHIDADAYGKATSLHKEVLLLHTADMMASHMLNI